MTDAFCGRCGNGSDPGDNYCRRCGNPLAVILPVVRRPALPARGQASIRPSFVGSVALLAVGTGLEWLARRVANNAAQAIVTRGAPGRRLKDAPPAADVTVNEFMYVRKVQLRR